MLNWLKSLMRLQENPDPCKENRWRISVGLINSTGEFSWEIDDQESRDYYYNSLKEAKVNGVLFEMNTPTDQTTIDGSMILWFSHTEI